MESCLECASIHVESLVMMKAVKETLVGLLVLGLLALVVGFTGNGIRSSRKRLDFTTNHFDFGLERGIEARAAAAARRSDPSPGESVQPVESADQPAVLTVVAPEAHAAHPYQSVSFDEAVAIFDDPNTQMGAGLFIDARGEEAYAEGHIPGALQADPYRFEDYWDKVMRFAEGAEKIVVYCNGGECEDSIKMCTQLLDADLNYDAIFLFDGGWEAWTAGDMPVETGADPYEDGGE